MLFNPNKPQFALFVSSVLFIQVTPTMPNCSYNCSDPPSKVEPDLDITGTGVSYYLQTWQQKSFLYWRWLKKVLTGYIATAGIVVVIVTVHYFIIHQPDLDPFRSLNGLTEPNQGVPFRPNPVDKMILGLVRRVRKDWWNNWCWSRLEPSVIKVWTLALCTEDCIWIF